MSIRPAEQYIEKLNQIPPRAKRVLHQLRQIDLQVLHLQNQITSERQIVIEKIVDYETKKLENQRAGIEQILKNINKIHKQLLNHSEKKKDLAEQLYNSIDAPTEMLEEDLSKIIPDQIDDKKKSKRRRGRKSEVEEYQILQPNYCYCQRPSFGFMVKCDNQDCQVQWFHIDCIDHKRRGVKDNWLCNQCRKVPKRSRKPKN